MPFDNHDYLQYSIFGIGFIKKEREIPKEKKTVKEREKNSRKYRNEVGKNEKISKIKIKKRSGTNKQKNWKKGFVFFFVFFWLRFLF